MKGLAFGLAMALVFPGCAFLRGEGEESLRVSNLDGQPVEIIVQIAPRQGGPAAFGESIVLNPGGAREFVLVMSAGAYTLTVTTSTSIQESILVEIPTRGDTLIDVTVRRGSASVTTTSR